ncbi:MAG: GntR family transcriptional regulator [Acidobacteria bacterium]|nr:GntR family transcriptional regulator [Acidobacteriota bacterium]
MTTVPLVEIHVDSPVPVYRQITDSLRGHLVAGRLEPGDLLPPVRQLAMDLGVHFNTVAHAYRDLAEEGWLDLKRRRGAMVIARGRPGKPDQSRIGILMTRLRDLTAELRSAGLTDAQVAAALRHVSKGSKP